MVGAPRLIAAPRAPGSNTTGVRQICRPVSTSIANVHFPLITYMTPLYTVGAASYPRSFITLLFQMGTSRFTVEVLISFSGL